MSNGNRPVAQTANGKKGGCGGLKRGKPIAAAAKHGNRDTGHDRLGLDMHEGNGRAHQSATVRLAGCRGRC